MINSKILKSFFTQFNKGFKYLKYQKIDLKDKLITHKKSIKYKN